MSFRFVVISVCCCFIFSCKNDFQSNGKISKSENETLDKVEPKKVSLEAQDRIITVVNSQLDSLYDWTEKENFLNNTLKYFTKKDLNRINNLICDSIKGEWAFVVRDKTKILDWSNSNFIRNYETIFNKESIEKLNSIKEKDIEFIDGKLHIGIGFITIIDGFKYESGTRLIFSKQNENWKLWGVFYAG